MATMMSMTGFGRGDAQGESFRVSVEISSVNRKQLDIVVTLPRDLQNLEPLVKNLIQKSATRGRIHARILIEQDSGSEFGVKVNTALFGQYQAALAELMGTRPGEIALDAPEILQLQGVVTLDEASVEAESLTSPLETATRSALAAWNAMRATEGEHLADDLNARLATIEAEVIRIRERSPKVIEHYRTQLRERIAKAGVDLPVDHDRLATEIVVFTDRADISEETTRLASHFSKFRNLLVGTEPCGRPLDFLLQEMHREVNTIGSKANDAEIAQSVVTCKTELEKIREQVQNIE